MRFKLLSMHHSNLIGQSYDHQIPSLAKTAKMTFCSTIKLLCILKMSEYEGKDPKILQKSIRKTEAQEYLTDLILHNAKLRSEL